MPLRRVPVSWGVLRFLFPIILLFVSRAACAQEIEIHSEFQRFNPYGRTVAQDREPRPREILSPAAPRNGHLSVHVVVTAPPGTNYFLYAGTSPANILKVRIYREHFAPCGDDFCPDFLTEQQSPSFGAIPESIYDKPNQTSRSYLFDIWIPPDVPPRRVRVEALIKVGIWMVAPMEVRVVEPTVPDTAGLPVAEDIASIDAPAGSTARRQILRYLDGLPPEMPPGLLRLRDVIQRNAAEDMLLARSMDVDAPELWSMAWSPFVFPELGAEWYLRVRDFIYRYNRF